MAGQAVKGADRIVHLSVVRDEERALIESERKMNKIFFIIAASSMDAYADSPSIALVELTEELMQTIRRMRAVREQLPDGAIIRLRTGAVSFYDHTDFEDDAFGISFSEKNDEMGQGVIVEEPGTDITQHALSTDWDRLEVQPLGIVLQSAPAHASHLVESVHISYERLEELFFR